MPGIRDDIEGRYNMRHSLNGKVAFVELANDIPVEKKAA